MAQALQVDWELIREMYTQGVPVKQISAETGVQQSTLTSKACRAGWKAKAAQAKAFAQSVSGAVVSVSNDGESLGNQSGRARAALADVLTRSAEKLKALDIRSPSHALKVNKEAEAMVRNAKTVFGWSEGQSAPSVRIAIMSQTTIQTDAQAETKVLPVVEVQAIAQALTNEDGPEPAPDL